MEISWDRCHIYQGCESKREDLRKWFNGTIIYRTLLDNLLEFKKEDCVLVAIKFDIEITTVAVNTLLKCKVASACHLTSKLEKAN